MMIALTSFATLSHFALLPPYLCRFEFFHTEKSQIPWFSRGLGFMVQARGLCSFASNLPPCATPFRRLGPLSAKRSTGLFRDVRAFSGSRPLAPHAKKIQNLVLLNSGFFGAGKRTRTSMKLLSHGPEPCASASSAMPA